MNISRLKAYSNEKYIKSLTKKEKDSIYNYSLDSYDVNLALRNDEKLNKDQRILVKKLDSALDKFVLPKSIILYRKIDVHGFNNAYKLIKEWEHAGIIHDKGYVSTSVNDYSYNNFFDIMLFIKFPQNAKGAYINDLAYFDEEEFLIKRDSIMDIEDINYTYNTNIENNAFIVKTKVRG